MADQPDGRKPSPDERAGAQDDRPRERRARERVKDDAQSGQGSMSALSRLKMMERKNAALRALRLPDVG